MILIHVDDALVVQKHLNNRLKSADLFVRPINIRF